MCIHSKCSGSMEFSWHCSQLHGTSANTICANPFVHEKGSQSGTNGAGSGPRYAHNNPAFCSTGYAEIRILSLNLASGPAISSHGCSVQCPDSSNCQP